LCNVFVVLINTVVGILSTAWLAWQATRSATAKELVRFSDATGVELTDRTTPRIGAALERGRLARFGGAIAGIGLCVLIPAFSDVNNVPSAFTGLITGYALGTLGAGLFPGTRTNDVSEVALIAPRRLSDYLPRSARLWLSAAIVLDVISIAVWRLGRNRPSEGFTSPLVPSIVAIAIALATLAGAHLIVRRRQSSTDRFELRLDDALRTRSIHLIMATGVATVAFSAGLAASAAASRSDVQVVRWVLPWFGIAMALGAWMVFNWYRSSWWQVTRVPDEITA
jgi:hypothetical protein